MQFFREELMEIVARASTLAERLSPEFIPDLHEGDGERIDARLSRWRHVLSKGNADHFQWRLESDGLDERSVRRALGQVRLAEGYPLPAWTKALEEVVRSSSGSPLQPDLEAFGAVPFAEILLPFLHFARRQLLARLGPCGEEPSGSARKTLERNLLDRLASLAGPALNLEFGLYRTLRQPRLMRRLQAESAPDCRILYKAFAEHLRTGGLAAFLTEYAVLARLLTTAALSWVEACAEFFIRLARDRRAIAERFQDGQSLGAIESVWPSLSDPHAGGRSVIAVRFACGLRLFYKPRPIGLERCFFEFLEWLNRQGPPLPFRLLKVIDAVDYGWMEHAKPEPCRNDDEASRYFRRAGMLLAVTHVLNGTDCHSENLIACGEHPVLVDLETFLHPGPRPQRVEDDPDGNSGAAEQLNDSVLQTGLLPFWALAPDGRVYDAGGLSGAGDQAVSYRAVRWRDINTDAMTLEYERTSAEPHSNLPNQEGTVLSPQPYAEHLLAGFVEMYRFLMRCRPALLAPAGPLGSFSGQRGRYLFRDTKIYAMLMQKSIQPEYLRDGVDQSIELEVLGRALLSSGNREWAGLLLKTEQRTLQQLDIPLFSVATDSPDLRATSDVVMEGFFAQSGLDRVRSRIRGLSENDLRQQADFIRMALYSRYSPFTGAARHTVAGSSRAPIGPEPDPLSSEELLEQAAALASDLRARAVVSDDGCATWIGLSYVTAGQRQAIKAVGDGLYEGCCGVALFLAALESVSNHAACGDLARDSLRHLSRRVRRPRLRQELVEGANLGAAGGLGGMIYCLSRVGGFLKEPSLLEDARTMAAAITPEIIAADTQLDVLGGAAGAILGLLTLHRMEADPAVLELAAACGRHLADRLVSTGRGRRSWPSLEGRFFTGFSHGAAGIACSLLRLWEVAGNVAFLEAAREGIEFERSLFAPQAGNWPIADEAPAEFYSSWCYGAPGIALARLGRPAGPEVAGAEDELEAALRTTRNASLEGADHLCCGNMGRIEVLFESGRRLGRADLCDATRRQAATIVRRANLNGRFQLFDGLPEGLTHAGFFQGTAGIGYTLLRLAFPGRFPCVLLWE